MKKIKFNIPWDNILVVMWCIFLVSVCYLAFPIVTLIGIGILVLLYICAAYYLKELDKSNIKQMQRFEELSNKKNKTAEEEEEFLELYMHIIDFQG